MEAILKLTLQVTRDIAPGFDPQVVVARSVKTHLVLGTWRGEDVVAKILSNSQPHWRWYLTREMALYRWFQRHPPPVPIPRLVAADPRRGVLIMTHQRGRQLARGRNAAVRVDAAVVTRIAQDLLRLGAWGDAPDEAALPGEGLTPRRPGVEAPRARALPDPRDTVSWLRGGVRRWIERGLLDERMGPGLIHELDAAELRFAHGDMLLRNVLLQRSGPVYLDWEFAGAYPLGWDLAQLWVGLERAQRDVLDRIIDTLPFGHRHQTRCVTVLAAARELEVRRFSLAQPREHPLVQRLERSLELALGRIG